MSTSSKCMEVSLVRSDIALRRLRPGPRTAEILVVALQVRMLCQVSHLFRRPGRRVEEVRLECIKTQILHTFSMLLGTVVGGY